MRFDLLQVDGWDQVCDQYRSRLTFGQDSTQTVQVYRGYSQAVLEVTLGIAKIFAHKKTIAVVADGEPIFETISQVFSSDGYEVLFLKAEDLQNPAGWFEAVKDQLLFVLHGEDDPVTGLCLEIATMSAFFKDKRIFRIQLAHAAFRLAPLAPLLPFEARILSFAPDRALLIGGSRCKIRPVFTPQMPWLLEDLAQIETDLKTWSNEEQAVRKARVLDFEARPPVPFISYFLGEKVQREAVNRVFDRILISCKEFDGLAVVSALTRRNRELKAAPATSASAGADKKFEAPINFATLSPCYWQSERLLEWRRQLGDQDSAIRGLIALPADADLEQTRLTLGEVIAELRLIQDGPVADAAT